MTDKPMSELAILMLCAWNGISRYQALPSWTRQPGPSVDAWNRVATAAETYLRERGGVE